MFLLQKLVSRLFFPLPLVLAVGIAGLVLIGWTKRQLLLRRYETGRSQSTSASIRVVPVFSPSRETRPRKRVR